MRIDSPSAVDFLTQAALILQERGEQRRLPNGERSMARIVQIFNLLMGRDLTELEGWIFMKVLKMTRAVSGEFQPDDLLDDISYSALALEHLARVRGEQATSN